MSEKSDSSTSSQVTLRLDGIAAGAQDQPLTVQFDVDSAGYNFVMPASGEPGLSISSPIGTIAGINGFGMTASMLSVTVAAGSTLAGNLTFSIAGDTGDVILDVNISQFTGPQDALVTYTDSHNHQQHTNLDDNGNATLRSIC